VPTGPFVLDIDPVIATVSGVHVWWYGLSYTLGFVNAYLSVRRQRGALGFTDRDVLELVLMLAAGVLAGGRLVAVFHARDFFAAHLSLIPAVWLGGMATHGLILGGFTGVGLFCAIRRKPYRVVFDALAIPTAVILAVGRIGNFIDGQIVGSVTTMPWGVKFPEAEGFRHPVVLYDGVKNLLLVPILMWARHRNPPAGRLAALFLFLYAALRIPIDLFREYPQSLLGLPAGQAFNVFFALAGVALLIRNAFRVAEPRGIASTAPPAASGTKAGGLWLRRLAFFACLAFPTVIPSDGLRDVPRVYGHRHAGIHYTSLYVPLPDR
jgi:phosphatidylglycerol:prolipoprotein diacylglycerol transferase